VTVNGNAGERLKAKSDDLRLSVDLLVDALLHLEDWVHGQAPYHDPAADGISRIDVRRKLEQLRLAPDR
jgi:hypothetical protein